MAIDTMGGLGCAVIYSAQKEANSYNICYSVTRLPGGGGGGWGGGGVGH